LERNVKKHHHPLPSFSLQSRHIGKHLLGAEPSKFHSHLCNKIRSAQERVYLASLYIGPGASPDYHQELELLDALQHHPGAKNSNGVRMKILMDQNRGLRQIPNQKNKGDVISSAQAIAQAILLEEQNENNSLHLFQVLNSPLDALLPNPLNEAAGVFHLKLYIIDDSLIISGANLSQEYFTDRQDRYLEICNGGNGLVDFYARLVDILCNFSMTYNHHDLSSSDKASGSKVDLLYQINQLFRDDNPSSSQDLLTNDKDTVAVCIPTFHAPKGFWPQSIEYFTDVNATLALLREGGAEEDSSGSVQLSSAYLNPTSELLRAFSKYPNVDLVTAGRQSHGFKPKSDSKAAGNRGKYWIPTVFDHLAYNLSQESPHVNIRHWERPGWTFHSKGLWLQQEKELAAAVIGSSNFGGRSFVRDMESNLIMVFSPSSRESEISRLLQHEWQELMHHSKQVDTKELVKNAPPLPMHVQSLLPFIKSFF
jgi:CDP-diacylglycerol--glycerol-3-phosphate 3-phosphatidyltransferase